MMVFDRPTYILADDFTGANDVGVALASKGYDAQIVLSTENAKNLEASCQIICTDSRDLDKNKAANLLSSTAQSRHLSKYQPLLIKKVDSTLRGNIGSEIQGLLDNGYEIAIIVIAAPNVGRKTQNGECYVNDVPLLNTEFATDPKSPIGSSRIKTIISSQTNTQIAEYHDEDHGHQSLIENFIQLYEQGSKIIVCDAVTHTDMANLYQAAFEMQKRCVFVTTGEITQAITFSGEEPKLKALCFSSPLFAVIGSISPVTQQQTQALCAQENVITLMFDSEKALTPTTRTHYINELTALAAQALNSGHHCVLRSSDDKNLRHVLAEIAQHHNVTSQELAETVRDTLAQFTRSVIDSVQNTKHLGGLLVCGGDIAMAVAKALDAQRFQIKGQVAHCVPWGYLNSPLTPFPIFTKAGGFGDETTFLQLLDHMKQEVTQ